MASPSKSIITPDPIVLQQISAGAEAVYSASPLVLEFDTKFSGAVYWDFAPIANTASPAATVLQLLTNDKAAVDTEDDSWSIIQDWLSPTAVPTLFTGVAGTAGASTFTFAAGTPAVYADHFIKGASVNEAGSEWVHIVKITGLTATIRGTLKNTYAAATCYSNALKQRFELDFSNLIRYKLMIGNNRGATNRDTANRVRIVTLDSVA